MTRRIKWLWSLLLMAMPLLCEAQTGLYTYAGGYFIRDGKTWKEYRPTSGDGVWATYTPQNEESNYYVLKNNGTSVIIRVPKTSSNSFYRWKNGKWQVLYKTKEIYNYFKDTSRQIYCYKGGYFVRDGNNWRQYQLAQKVGVSSSYTQYNEDSNYYYIQNSTRKISVPKTSNNQFYVYRNGAWSMQYNTVDIYDRTIKNQNGRNTNSAPNNKYGQNTNNTTNNQNRQNINNNQNQQNTTNTTNNQKTEYDVTFAYSHCKVFDSKKWKTVNKTTKISFDRKGKGVLEYGGKTYKFTYGGIKAKDIPYSALKAEITGGKTSENPADEPVITLEKINGIDENFIMISESDCIVAADTDMPSLFLTKVSTKVIFIRLFSMINHKQFWINNTGTNNRNTTNNNQNGQNVPGEYTYQYNSYKIKGSDGKMKEVKSPAKISFNRKGKGVLVYGNTTQKFSFSSISHERGAWGGDFIRIRLSDNMLISIYSIDSSISVYKNNNLFVDLDWLAVTVKPTREQNNALINLVKSKKFLTK